MPRLPRPCLYAVSDRRLLAAGARTLTEELRQLDHWIDEGIAAGVDVIQIRERDLDAAPLHTLALRATARAGSSATMILVNDRSDVAAAAGAAGVHLRADGPPATRVRAIGPEGWLVGRSVHTPAEAAAAHDADYVLFGTVFPSITKGAGAPHGEARDTQRPGERDRLEALRHAVAASAGPVLAIGGITPDRARACISAGAAGVAGIGLFLAAGTVPGAMGMREAVAALREAIATALPRGLAPQSANGETMA